MKEEQFRELMECLKGISSRLDAIEDSVSAFESMADDLCSLLDVASDLRRIQTAIKDAVPITIHDLDDVHGLLQDVKRAQPPD